MSTKDGPRHRLSAPPAVGPTALRSLTRELGRGRRAQLAAAAVVLIGVALLALVILALPSPV